MSYFNFYFGRLCYLDTNPTQTPKYQHFNAVTKSEEIRVLHPASLSKVIPPNQSITLESGLRTLTPNLSTSEFSFLFPLNPDKLRIRFVSGVHPNFRTPRAINYGDDPELTTYSSSALSATSKLLTFSGTNVDFSAAQYGDIVYFQQSDNFFTSPINNSTLLNQYTVLSATSTTLTVRDLNNTLVEEVNIPLGTNFDSVIRVFSAEGVQVGDKISFNSSSDFSIDNKTGTFSVVEVTDRDISIINPNGIIESVESGVANPFFIYNYMIDFLAIEGDGEFSLKINGGTEIIVSEISYGKSFFASSVAAYSIEIINSKNNPLSISSQTVSKL